MPLDVSYVGTHIYNPVLFGSFSVPANHDPMDLSAPDIGTAYLPQYQDATASASTVPGARALPTGTLTLRHNGNTFSPRHLQHNADGTIGLRPEQDAVDEVLSNAGLRGHLIKGNFVWDLPERSADSPASTILAAVVNDWQVSGVFTGGSGARNDVTYSYQTPGANVNLTGSPNYRARIRTVSDIGSGCSSDQYAQFNANAFAAPTYNSLGDESGANLLNGCWDHTTVLAIARNIRIGGSRQLQFRVDLFNAFNSAVINARSTTIQYNNPSASTTITNNQCNSDGTVNAARLTPATAGAATAAQPMRSARLQLRFTF